MFDAMGALSSKYNENTRKKAFPRAYDANRDGFVIAGGGRIARLLKELEHAKGTWRENHA